MEFECIATCAATNEAIWARKILIDMCEIQQKPTVLYCESKLAIAIAKNPV